MRRVLVGCTAGCMLGVAFFGAVVGAAHGQSARLCLSGSNTVGERLAPALVRGWAEAQGGSVVAETSPALDEMRLDLRTPTGRITVDVLAHGTSTGYAALRDRECDLWMAYRAVRKEEVEGARSIGELFERGQEHVIALDGLAVIVHPSNPLSALTVEQVRAVFSGRITDWSSIGGVPGAIALHARDDRSGTFDTFRSLVLGETTLSPRAARYESTMALSNAVSSDPRAIGFVGLAELGRARVLALSERGTVPMAPARLTVATEDYVLSRRLYFYSASRLSAEAQAFVDFAQGASGQEIVANVGYVPQDIAALAQPDPSDAQYRDLVSDAQRLSLNFRFGEGAAVMDSKAMADIDRLTRFMALPENVGKELLLIGFADRTELTPYMALSLSNDRVDLVAAELRARGLRIARQRGLGQIAPVASNESPQGRQRNRRVEVWIRPVGAATAVGGQR